METAARAAATASLMRFMGRLHAETEGDFMLTHRIVAA
jgi:hypothetical protein